MRVEQRAIARMSGCALLVAASLGLAFEPGAERICEPSADRTRFECRAKTGADITPARRTAAQAVAAPVEAPSATVDAPTETVAAESPVSADNARALPSYLRSPSADRVSEPVPVAAAPPEPAPPAVPANTLAVPRDEPSARPVAAPAASAPMATRIDTPARMPAIDVQSGEDARAFALLPASRYTLEIARARGVGELAALAIAFTRVQGRVYFVRMRGADGPSYSILWSDFATIDAAREARATLPADIAVTSGWPRRIGPMQAELVGQ